MKLKLKYLVGYLPHKLNLMIDGVICEIEGFDLHREDTIIVERVNYKLSEIIPILKPLSRLTREELEKAGFCDHIDYLTYENRGVEWTLKAPYTHIEYLLSKHYDIYGLIPAGLAIDINTL